MNRRIGIYPGTFDPIHLGHIAFAKEAMKTCGLHEVVFLPEQKPRGKDTVTSITHRIALIECAITNDPSFRVTQLTSERFTVADTLAELQASFSDSQLTFLIGSDVARSLYAWEGVATLLSSVSFAVGMRSTDTEHNIRAVLDQLAITYAVPVRYSFVHTSMASMTSSHIRNGDTNSLPVEVAGYIEQHRLYMKNKN